MEVEKKLEKRAAAESHEGGGPWKSLEEMKGKEVQK